MASLYWKQWKYLDGRLDDRAEGGHHRLGFHKHMFGIQGSSRDLTNVCPGCDNPGSVIPKHKFHEPKAHFHSENPSLQNPC